MLDRPRPPERRDGHLGAVTAIRARDARNRHTGTMSQLANGAVDIRAAIEDGKATQSLMRSVTDYMTDDKPVRCVDFGEV